MNASFENCALPRSDRATAPAFAWRDWTWNKSAFLSPVLPFAADTPSRVRRCSRLGRLRWSRCRRWSSKACTRVSLRLPPSFELLQLLSKILLKFPASRSLSPSSPPQPPPSRQRCQKPNGRRPGAHPVGGRQAAAAAARTDGGGGTRRRRPPLLCGAFLCSSSKVRFLVQSSPRNKSDARKVYSQADRKTRGREGACCVTH